MVHVADAPRPTSRYAVVDGRAYRARYVIGGPEPVLLADAQDAAAAGFARRPDGSWSRTVAWDDVERLFEVRVWWRLPGGFPVAEVERDGDRVLVETDDDPPYRRRGWRGPRGLTRDRSTGASSGWVDAATLTDRCEIETEYDVAFFRVPVEQWPPTGAGPGPVVRTSARRRGAGDVWEVLDDVVGELPW